LAKAPGLFFTTLSNKNKTSPRNITPIAMCIIFGLFPDIAPNVLTLGAVNAGCVLIPSFFIRRSLKSKFLFEKEGWTT